MNVLLERHIEQIQDGERYRGYVKIGGSRFDYRLTFGTPIDRIGSMQPPEDERGIRRLFQIDLERDNAKISLAKEEYCLFLEMIAAFAISFYNNPQTREAQEGAMGNMLRGGYPLTPASGKASIGMTRNESLDLPPEICEMLNQPKFGCKLAA